MLVLQAATSMVHILPTAAVTVMVNDSVTGPLVVAAALPCSDLTPYTVCNGSFMTMPLGHWITAAVLTVPQNLQTAQCAAHDVGCVPGV